jgi:curved DNA-binding protein CbpA
LKSLSNLATRNRFCTEKQLRVAVEQTLSQLNRIPQCLLVMSIGSHSQMAQNARRIVEAKDLYDVLQLGHDVTPEDIKKAYHRTSKMVHPDKNKARQSDEAFKRVGEAFRTLSDPGQKQVYDLGLETASEHRTEVATRGAMNAHLRVCAGSAAGSSGVAVEQAAGHEAVDPIEGFHCWMAAGVAAGVAAQRSQLHAHNAQLQAHNAQLQAHNAQLQAQNHQMHIQTMQLQAQNEQLQRQATGLQHVMQPLVDRVRALEDDAEAGGRRQRPRGFHSRVGL